MRQRGRQAGAAGNVRKAPAPPPGLHPVALELWQKITGSLPDDWFPAETEPLLEAYVTSYVIFKRVNNAAQDILNSEKLTAEVLTELDALRRLAGREISNLAQLATRMRLSQSSTKSKGNTKHKAPAMAWESTE